MKNSFGQRLLSSFNHTIDRLPLAGKYLTEPCAKAYTRANPGRDKLKFGAAASAIGGMVLVHAWQARLGVDSLATHLEYAEHAEHLPNGIFMGIDTIFTVVNAAVAVRQSLLLQQLNKIRQRKKERTTSSPLLQDENSTPEIPAPGSTELPVSEATSTASPERTNRRTYIRKRLAAICVAGLVTCGGQIAFLESSEDAHSLICIADAEKILDVYETAGLTDLVASETILLANICGVSPHRLER